MCYLFYIKLNEKQQHLFKQKQFIKLLYYTTYKNVEHVMMDAQFVN